MVANNISVIFAIILSVSLFQADYIFLKPVEAFRQKKLPVEAPQCFFDCAEAVFPCEATDSACICEFVILGVVEVMDRCINSLCEGPDLAKAFTWMNSTCEEQLAIQSTNQEIHPRANTSSPINPPAPATNGTSSGGLSAGAKGGIIGGVIGGVILLVGMLTLGIWIGRTSDSARPLSTRPTTEVDRLESGQLAPVEVSGQLQERQVDVGGRLNPENSDVGSRLRYE